MKDAPTKKISKEVFVEGVLYCSGDKLDIGFILASLAYLSLSLLVSMDIGIFCHIWALWLYGSDSYSQRDGYLYCNG